MYGRGISLDVRRDGSRLHVHRVLDLPLTRLRSGSSARRCPSSIRAPPGEIAAGARRALEEAVRSDTSYLGIWSTYQAMERDTILRRARLLGALPYERCELRHDGGHRFYLAAADDLGARLDALSEDERIELEAGRAPPSWDHLEEEVRRDREGTRVVAPGLASTSSAARWTSVLPRMTRNRPAPRRKASSRFSDQQQVA